MDIKKFCVSNIKKKDDVQFSKKINKKMQVSPPTATKKNVARAQSVHAAQEVRVIHLPLALAFRYADCVRASSSRRSLWQNTARDVVAADGFRGGFGSPGCQIGGGGDGSLGRAARGAGRERSQSARQHGVPPVVPHRVDRRVQRHPRGQDDQHLLGPRHRRILGHVPRSTHVFVHSLST